MLKEQNRNELDILTEGLETRKFVNEVLKK